MESSSFAAKPEERVRPVLGRPRVQQADDQSTSPGSVPTVDGSIAVVLPALNEAANLPPLVRSLEDMLESLERPYRVIVVDDGSQDQTAMAARRASRNGAVEVLRHADNRGLGRALRTGLLKAASEFDVVVTMDADHTHGPELIPEMLDRLDAGSDVVVASRFQEGAETQGVPRHRRLLSSGASALLRVLTPVPGVRDYSSGYRAYRGDLLRRAIKIHGEEGIVQESGFACMAELLFKLNGVGASFDEVPLDLRYDKKSGESKMEVAPTLRRYASVIRIGRRWAPALDDGDVRGAELTEPDPGIRRDRICRFLNVAAACVGLVAAAPLMLLIAMLIKVTSRGPVLFTQTRIGLDRRRDHGSDAEDPRRQVDYGGKPFTIYKFRTMYQSEVEAEEQVWATPDDPRVTPLGRVLRKFRLDELPQLFNVLKGDMNVVGPRPEQPEIARRLRDGVKGYRYRHRVRPGITGWAQVNHTYDRSVDDVRRKVHLDLEYVWSRSAVQDIKILLRTVPVVLMRKGAW